MCATKRKSYVISKWLVARVYRLVEANAGAAGVDKESIERFAKDLKNNLYKIWNRMSSGSYFPPPVRAVAIPKKAWWTTHSWHPHGSGQGGADRGQTGY